MTVKKNIRFFGYLFILIVILISIELTGVACMIWFSPDPNRGILLERDYFKIRKMLKGGEEGRSIPRYLSQPYYPYCPNPGYNYKGIAQHNEQGYRGKKVPLKKTKDKFRILCLGGSTTYGTTVDDPSHSYPSQLEMILNEWHQTGKLRLSAQSVEVINGGVEAGTSAEELTHYLFKFRYYQPDLLIIHSGGNDAMIDPSEPNFQPDYTHFRRLLFHLEPLPAKSRWLLNSYFISFLTINLFYSDFVLQGEYHSHSDNRSYIRWMDNPAAFAPSQTDFSYYPFYRNHSTLIDAALADSCSIINLTFAINPNDDWVKRDESYRRHVDLNNRIIEQLSRQKSVDFLPYHYDSILKPELWLDDCHLNEEGEREKSQMIANKIFSLYHH